MSFAYCLLALTLCGTPDSFWSSQTRDFQWRLNAWADVTGYWTERQPEDLKIDVSHIYALNQFKMGKKWSAVIEVALEREYERSEWEPERELTFERAYVQYKWNPQAALVLGKFYTPCGLYKRRHWAYTMDTYQKPIIEENQYIPAVAFGAEFNGNKSWARGVFNYSLLISDGRQDNSKPVDDQFGYGGDFNVNQNDRFLIGYSVYRYESEYEDDLYFNIQANQAYLEWELVQNKLQWRIEWLFLERMGLPRTDGYYTQIKWNLNESLYFNARWEEADDMLQGDDERHKAILLTMGIHLPKQWRVKLEYSLDRFDTGDRVSVNQLGFWVGHAF